MKQLETIGQHDQCAWTQRGIHMPTTSERLINGCHKDKLANADGTLSWNIINGNRRTHAEVPFEPFGWCKPAQVRREWISKMLSDGLSNEGEMGQRREL